MKTVKKREMCARTLPGKQYGVFKELKNTCVAGVREVWENVSIKLHKVYNSAL